MEVSRDELDIYCLPSNQRLRMPNTMKDTYAWATWRSHKMPVSAWKPPAGRNGICGLALTQKGSRRGNCRQLK